VLRNRFNIEWENRAEEIAARRAELRGELQAAAQRGDSSVVDISAGVGAGLIHSLEAAGEIVRRIVDEAEHILRDRHMAFLRDEDR
jgi:nitronate monooxygenase